LVWTQEQEAAKSLFEKGENLRIDAYAGAGKTTTLRLLAESSTRRGLYLSFNRNLADEARLSFPSRVTCATSHSLAFRAILRRFRYPARKLTGSLTLNAIVEASRMPDHLSFRSGLILDKWSYSSILVEALKGFLRSDDLSPLEKHVPRTGCLATLTDIDFRKFVEQAIVHVCAIWTAMVQRDSTIPLGHDGYLKLWALSNPTAFVEYVLVDEAQDLNPVLLGVLQRINCQVVYVGDPYQQIYEWRGAINAMETVSIQHHVRLTQSYRFGPDIAACATKIISRLGAVHPVQGLHSIASFIGPVDPNAIISRTNTGVIRNLFRSLSSGLSCFVLGGTKALESLLIDVVRVKQGAIAQSAELLGFSRWQDVMSFSAKSEGDHLRGLVSLVEEYGEDRLLRTLAQCCPNERDADIVCSTVHRAKGREWDYVQIDSDFLAVQGETARKPAFLSDPSELRLLYVAATRARYGLSVPGFILNNLGIQERSTAREYEVECNSSRQSNAEIDHRLLGVVSPYHSPLASETCELKVLRRRLS
jgi:hypothetical protein